MPNAEEVFTQFQKCEYGYDWTGAVTYPFWSGRTLETIIAIDHDITHPTRGQLSFLDALLAQQEDILPSVESVLFDHYQNDIYGSVAESGKLDQWQELTPTLETSDQIWTLLGDPGIRIDYIGDDETFEDMRFILSYFSCPWDDEHGFGIQIANWMVDGFCGEAG